jgi:hypothetical protein
MRGIGIIPARRDFLSLFRIEARHDTFGAFGEFRVRDTAVSTKVVKPSAGIANSGERKWHDLKTK